MGLSNLSADDFLTVERFAVLGPMMLVASIPDMVSILVYFWIRRRVKEREVANHAAEDDLVQQGEEPPYGGIFVGGTEDKNKESAQGTHLFLINN